MKFTYLTEGFETNRKGAYIYIYDQNGKNLKFSQ